MTKLERFTMGALGWLVLAGFVWFASTLVKDARKERLPAVSAVPVETVVDVCTKWVKRHAAYPSSVEIKHFLSGLDDTRRDRSVWNTTFSALNAHGVRQDYVLVCEVDTEGRVEATISQP